LASTSNTRIPAFASESAKYVAVAVVPAAERGLVTKIVRCPWRR